MTDQDKGSNDAALIALRLRAVSVGSFLFQLGVTERQGLHPTDLHAIYLLGRASSGLTAGALGAGLGLTSGSTTAVLGRLERRGFVTRGRDPADGRRAVLSLSAEAHAALAEEYAAIDGRVRAAISQLDEAERAVVARFLAAIVEDEASEEQGERR